MGEPVIEKSLLLKATMSATKAIAYCATSPTTEEDGERMSASVRDRNGDRHWIAWDIKEGVRACPRFCSESPYEFPAFLEPYLPI